MNKILLIRDKSTRQNILDKVITDVLDIPMDSFIEQEYDGSDVIDHIDGVEVVILVGEEALNKVLHLRGVTKYSGTERYMNGWTVFPLVSPGYIDEHPNKVGMFAEHIMNAYNYANGIETPKPENIWKYIRTVRELRIYIKYIKQTGYCAFDFETSTLKGMKTFDPDFVLTCLSISYQQGSSIVIPIRELDQMTVLEMGGILNKEVFENHDIIKIGHNVKFDMHCATHMGIRQFNGPFHDTMLLAQLLDEHSSNKLKDVVRMYFPRFANYEAKLDNYTWEDIPMEILARYNAMDSDVCLRIYMHFTDLMLTEEKRIYNLYRNLTAPATVALFWAEDNGMLIDREYLEDSIDEADKIIAKHEAKMRKNATVVKFETYMRQKQTAEMILKLQNKCDIESKKTYKTEKAIANQQKRLEDFYIEIDDYRTGKKTVHNPVSFSSPVQMSKLLYSKEGFNFDLPIDPITDKPKSGTGKDVLLYISDRSGFIEDLLAYRQMTKIRSTYLIGILDILDDENYVHASFNQHVTKTGRLSSSGPNLQNIITRTKYKAVEEMVGFVKKAFAVPTGCNLLQRDYSQAELRLMAHFSQEKRMMDAFEHGVDIHELTASMEKGMTVEEFRKLEDKEYKQLRYEAKSENFGLIYGMSPGGYRDYARREYGMKLSKKQSEERHANFFKTYPGLVHYHRMYKAKAQKFGYVRTLFGRKCRLPDIYSPMAYKRSHAERNAINSPIQGTSGELTIWSFVILQHLLDISVIFVNTVHDDDKYYVPIEILAETKELIQAVAENLPLKHYFDKELTVPMKADFEMSRVSWGQLEPYV